MIKVSKTQSYIWNMGEMNDYLARIDLALDHSQCKLVGSEASAPLKFDLAKIAEGQSIEVKDLIIRDDNVLARQGDKIHNWELKNLSIDKVLLEGDLKDGIAVHQVELKLAFEKTNASAMGVPAKVRNIPLNVEVKDGEIISCSKVKRGLASDSNTGEVPAITSLGTNDCYIVVLARNESAPPMPGFYLASSLMASGKDDAVSFWPIYCRVDSSIDDPELPSLDYINGQMQNNCKNFITEVTKGRNTGGLDPQAMCYHNQFTMDTKKTWPAGGYGEVPLTVNEVSPVYALKYNKRTRINGFGFKEGISAELKCKVSKKPFGSEDKTLPFTVSSVTSTQVTVILSTDMNMGASDCSVRVTNPDGKSVKKSVKFYYK
jgi:hypothetical protein